MTSLPTAPSAGNLHPDISRVEERETPRKRFIRRFLANKSAVIAALYLVFLVLVAVFAPVLAPYDPLQQDLRGRLAEPLSAGHILGTDDLGRDTLSRLIFASRISLLAAVQAVGIGLVLGIPPGLIAGYLGGKWDSAVSRFADALMSFPALLLAVALVGVLGPSLTNAMIAVGVVFAPRFYRLVRGSVLAVREETYVEASRSIGTPMLRIVRTRVLPNVISPLIVQISLACGFSMLAEAGLSFIGLGVQPPDASWGSMLGVGRRFMEQNPWMVIIPGIAITLAVLAFNMLGDGIQDSIGREERSAS